MRTTLNFDQFFRPLANEGLFFYNDNGCYTSENNCSGQWRRESTGHMYDIMGLPDLASDGSPLFAEPMFLFGWALCNTSLHVNLLTELRELCSASLLHRPLQYIFTFALFWLPRINLSLQNQLPYYTISFFWTNSLLEPRFLCDECSVNLHNFFCEGKNTFP